MNRNVNAISGRLSLRKPQRDSLELLHRLTEILSWEKGGSKKSPDLAAALSAIRSEFPTVTDFEREFASLCFALATGVGKTRLMGAFIAYLHLEHGINNFFVMAPNLTIYNKLITDFTPNTRKYVFKGISEFATDAPEIITGDDYESKAGTLFDQLLRCKINIFNISKINSEVRGGKSPRIKRLSEYIGESYFEYLANLPDLVLIMDESHRYRASAGVRAINELKPILGLELTATPFVEGPKGAVPFKNVILDYPLGRAMNDGFVKEPAVVTRKDFSPQGMSAEAIEKLKLEDGVRMHEQTKVLLETYAREASVGIVKPFVLVIARDTTHAKSLVDLIKSQEFFEGRYKDKVIQVDSSKTGAEEDQMIQDLLAVENTESPTEIVIHVNMLKEGWDVTNLYTIVPLRAANARILIEQSIGRGLRLPYGKRTGVAAVDRLSIIAHDKFQEIVDEASKPGSVIKMQQVILSAEEAEEKTATVVSESNLKAKLGFQPENQTRSTENAGKDTKPAFDTPEKQRVAQMAYAVIKRLEARPDQAPTMEALKAPEVQSFIVQEVVAQYQPQQLEMEGVAPKIDVAAIVSETTSLVVKEMIPIPRILVVPKGEVKSWFEPFTLELTSMKFPLPSKDLWVHNLHTNQGEAVTVGNEGAREKRMEDYVVSGLVDFDDVSYDTNADLLYDLATQTVKHFLSYLPEEEVWQVLHSHQKDIANAIHAQMHQHFREEVVGYEVVISRGFTELKDSAYTAKHGEAPLDYRQSPADKSNMAKYLFGGFKKCLYPTQKFHSDAERRLAGILERDAIKWFKPAKGQFQMFYREGANQPEYVPDFVAETETTIYMLEPKAKNEMGDPVVQAKKEVAETWCANASKHALEHGGKPWKYALIAHDVIADNMTLEGLAMG
ncbi:DEAD/DEAH box helicase [Prosthecobacter fluviatilis]|uniref:DEAD/DEAH box helicase n=1 Tax=Prosthecobacter fluviatilis TaxID=445931 RepID=A0ABW0KTY1_9BACT